MKILHTVESYYPNKNGMSEVVQQLSHRLAKAGHDVTVATTHTDNTPKTHKGVKIRAFKISGNHVHGYSGNYQEYQDFLLKSNFDVITNFAAQQWATDLVLTILDQLSAKKILVPTGFSGLYKKEYASYFDKMKIWMKNYDMNIFLSYTYRDIQFARENKIKKMLVIPNGADETEFDIISKVNIHTLLNIPINHKIILSVGSHTGLKGHREAIQIFKKAQLKNTTLLIVGNNHSNCYFECNVRKHLNNILNEDNRIIITELDRKSTIAAYQQASLFLFPSNVECSPIVLFEAAASKTPFLVTDVGNAKEIIKWLESGRLLPTRIDSKGYSHAKINESANLLRHFMTDEDNLEKLGIRGYQNWKKSYTWEDIAEQYELLYKELLKG